MFDNMMAMLKLRFIENVLKPIRGCSWSYIFELMFFIFMLY